MAYRIKIWYSTSDSFNTEDASDLLEMKWNNIDVAKANLKSIKDHYICYLVDKKPEGKKSGLFKSLSPEQKLMYDMKAQQPWYSILSYDNCYHHTLILKTDDGKDWQISPFWIGYFEDLKEGCVVTDTEDLDLYFHIDNLLKWR
jgi:hypothetical protein